MPKSKSKSKKSSSFYYSAEDNNIPRQPLFPIEEKQKTKKIRPPRPMRPYSPPKKTKKVRPPRPERPYAPPRHSRRAPFKMMPQQKLRKYSTPPMVEEAIEPVFKNPRKLSKKGSMEVGYNSKEDPNQNLYYNNYQPINSYSMEADAMVPHEEVLNHYQSPNEPPLEVQKEFKKKPSLEKKLSHFLKTRRNRRNFSMEGQTPSSKENVPLPIHYNSNNFEDLLNNDANSYEEKETLDYISNFMYSLNNQFHKYCRKNRGLIEEMDHKLLDFCGSNGVNLQKEVFGRGKIVGTEVFNSNLALKKLFKTRELNIPHSAEMISLVNVFEAEISKPKKTGKLKRMAKSYMGTQYDDAKLDRYFRFSLFTIIQRNAINYYKFRYNHVTTQDLQNSLYYCFFPNNDGSIRKVDIKKVFFGRSEEPLKELNINLGSEFMTELKNVQRIMKKGGARAPTTEAQIDEMGDFEILPEEFNLRGIKNVPRTVIGTEILEYYKFLVNGFIEFCQKKSVELKGIKLSEISDFEMPKTSNDLRINKETLELGRKEFSKQFKYSKDFEPLLLKLIDTKKAQQAAQLSTNTMSKKLTRKVMEMATSAGFMTEEITLEEKLFNHIFFKFFENDKKLLKTVKDTRDLKNKLILYFKEVISLGIVSSEEGPKPSKELIDRRVDELISDITKKPGVKGRNKPDIKGRNKPDIKGRKKTKKKKEKFK